MRLTIALAFVPLAVAVIHTDARATGLSASLSPSDGSLGRLDSLSVDVRLGPTAAEITQQRSYTLNSMYAGSPVELTFYDSVTGPAGTAPPAITINGQPAAGTTLEVTDADAARRRLTRLIGDPTALRGLGTPLYATDAMVVQAPTTNVIDVRITTTVPLATLGTMRGLVVPLDWSRLPVSEGRREGDRHHRRAAARALFALSRAPGRARRRQRRACELHGPQRVHRLRPDAARLQR